MYKSPRSSIVELSPSSSLAPVVGDSLPSADVLFGGGSTPFDLFQPQQRSPAAPAQKLAPTNSSSQPQSRTQLQSLQQPQPQTQPQFPADSDQEQEPLQPNRIKHHDQEPVRKPDTLTQTAPIPAPDRSPPSISMSNTQQVPPSNSDREHNADQTQDNTHKPDSQTHQGADPFAQHSAAPMDDGAHQDSSSLFAGSTDMDASHFFSNNPDTDTSMLFGGSSTKVSSPFFGSFSVQGSSALNGESHTAESAAGSSTRAVMDSDQSHKDVFAHQELQEDLVISSASNSRGVAIRSVAQNVHGILSPQPVPGFDESSSYPRDCVKFSASTCPGVSTSHSSPATTET
ncbi:hypothetical protein BGZ67_005117 [Mortierella alpina]|nr:hypothetical protein BGZ67_005117 [Mortierella alpina]